LACNKSKLKKNYGLVNPKNPGSFDYQIMGLPTQHLFSWQNSPGKLLCGGVLEKLPLKS
jgi:hypothetical protein